MLALADPEGGGLFSETEKLRISVSKIRLKSVFFILELLFEWNLPPFLNCLDLRLSRLVETYFLLAIY